MFILIIMPSRVKTSRGPKKREDNLPGEGPVSGPDIFDADRAEVQSDYLVVYDPEGTILYVNPAFAAAMGCTERQLAGTPLLSYIDEEYRETMTANMAALRSSSEPPFYETVLLSSGGIRRSVIVKGRPVWYDGQPAALVFFIDITERKALEDLLSARAEELFQISTAYQVANKKLTLLSSITRHDINNQMTVLKGYLEMLEMDINDPALAAYCSNAKNAADRIAAMIRFTSEYEKIGISAPAWQDCRDLVDTAITGAPHDPVTIRNDLPSGVAIYADPLVVKVVYNLVDNAVRYGGKITTICFSSFETDGNLVIVCEDDGDGIPAAEKERIFDRGFGRNTGLGLALSREILDITGITIRETGTPGTGARFDMTVPAGGFRYTAPENPA